MNKRAVLQQYLTRNPVVPAVREVTRLQQALAAGAPAISTSNEKLWSKAGSLVGK